MFRLESKFQRDANIKKTMIHHAELSAAKTASSYWNDENVFELGELMSMCQAAPELTWHVLQCGTKTGWLVEGSAGHPSCLSTVIFWTNPRELNDMKCSKQESFKIFSLNCAWSILVLQLLSQSLHDLRCVKLQYLSMGLHWKTGPHSWIAFSTTPDDARANSIDIPHVLMPRVKGRINVRNWWPLVERRLCPELPASRTKLKKIEVEVSAHQGLGLSLACPWGVVGSNPAFWISGRSWKI